MTAKAQRKVTPLGAAVSQGVVTDVRGRMIEIETANGDKKVVPASFWEKIDDRS